MNELFIRSLQIDWEQIEKGSYLRKIPALRGLGQLEFHSPVTFFAGENGSGKSTLLEAVAVAYGFNPEGGSRNYSFSTYDSHSELFKALRLIKGYRSAKWGYFLRTESFYNVASQDEEYARIGHVPSHEYHKKSHGESFLALAQDNFGADGLYLLDEPEAALSPQRQLTLLAELHRCCKEGSQFLIASHSPILLGLPGAEILSFDGPEIRSIPYEETDSYRVIKYFINNRQTVLNELLQ